MRQTLAGTIAAKGMTLGRARLLQHSRHRVDYRPLPENEIDAELGRLHRALDAARQELGKLRSKLHGNLAREVNGFIDAHHLLLDDPELLRALEELIKTGRYRSDAALKKQHDKLTAVFDTMDAPYLRGRKEDIDHIIARVMSALHQKTPLEERKLAARVGEILVAETIGPADLAHLVGNGLFGVVSSAGSAYSHSAILARSLGIPMLIDVMDALSEIHDNDLILLDAKHGEAIIHPAAQDMTRYRAWQRASVLEGRRLHLLTNAPTRSRDGIDISLLSNAESRADIALSLSYGADGVGLYRTEFLFLRGKAPPSEEEQFLVYRDLVLGMGGLSVTIRTLDVGADKTDTAGLHLHNEDNPALGVRGVRLSLRYPAIFTTQIRAILRAACYGPVRVLIPMVTQPDELIAVRTLFKLARDELKHENVDLPEKLPLGAMIEVPAAALGVRALLNHADFLAIGTNDLAQYVLAADRGNNALNDIYNPLQPALLRLVAHVISHGRRANKPVSLCGEIGGDTRFTGLLLSLGLTQFSMHPGQLLQIRDRISVLNYMALRRHAPKLLHARTSQEVETLLTHLDPEVYG